MQREGGFTLLEVMIAVLVLAVGLMAIAVMLGVGIRQSHVSATHNQVNLLAQSMIDRMAANVQGVWLGGYQGDYTGVAGFSTDCSAGCMPLELAARDRVQWQAEIAQMLPEGAQGRIDCSPSAPVPDAETLRKSPAYLGFCDLSIGWREGDVEGEVVDSEVSWRFTP